MKLGNACRILKMKPKSVNRVRINGGIKAVRLQNGQYDYDYDSVKEYLRKRQTRSLAGYGGDRPRERISVLYVRASHGSAANIENQKNRLMKGVKRHCDTNRLPYPKKMVKDHYSADEGKRRTGFRSLCRLVFKEYIDKVYVISAPRLFRGARSFLEIAFQEFGTKVVCLDELGKNLTPEEIEEEDKMQAIYLEVARKMHADRKEKMAAGFEKRQEQIAKEIPEARKKLAEYQKSRNKIGVAQLGQLIALYDDGIRHRSLLDKIGKHVRTFEDF
jgi:predicted site-specific integrase-resolvase